MFNNGSAGAGASEGLDRLVLASPWKRPLTVSAKLGKEDVPKISGRTGTGV